MISKTALQTHYTLAERPDKFTLHIILFSTSPVPFIQFTQLLFAQKTLQKSLLSKVKHLSSLTELAIVCPASAASPF